MKTILTSFFLLTIHLSLLNSVKAQKSEFEFKLNNENKLPALKADIDEEMLLRAYQSNNLYSNSRYYEEGEKHEYHETYMYNPNSEVNDAMQLLDRYIQYELTENSPNYSGRVKAIVRYYDYKKQTSVGMIFNFATFGVCMILGVPMTKYTTKVEIELLIYDANEELIKNVYGIGIKKYNEGLYSRKNQRELNIIAIKKALESVNEQIFADFDGLYQQLSYSTQ